MLFLIFFIAKVELTDFLLELDGLIDVLLQIDVQHLDLSL